MAKQTTAVERIEACVQGEVSGQIAIGKHILQIGSVHGGIVNVAVPEEQPRPRARSLPIQLRPRPFPGILNRTEESAAATRALECGQSVELFGESGIGKTVLLRYLAHKIDSTNFREGVIYREIHDDPPSDALQMLWGDFFECDNPFKPTDSQLRSDLQSKQALIIFDAVELSRVEVEQVMNVAATCTFLLGSPERHLWGDDAHATHLGGLPAKDAKTLVERELGRALTQDEASAVETVTIALKGNPLLVLQEVAMAQLNNRLLTSIAQDLQSGVSPEKLTARITAPLSDVQRRMLSALAIFSGASVRATTLGELLQVDDAGTILEELEERHLVRAFRGRYKLAGEVAPFMPKEMETTEERKRVVAYFADWIERNQDDVKTILETRFVLMRCLRWGVKFGMAAEVIRLAKSLEFTLVLNGYWETWANALGLAAQSAVGASDKAALGWVLHQNGTKALCDGNVAEARESLEQALQIREALRDKVGAEVTRHNLNLLVPLAVPPWKLWKLPVSLAAVTCALIAAVVFASKTPNLWHPPRARASTAMTNPAPAASPPGSAASESRTPSSIIPRPTRSAIGHPPSGISPFTPPVTAPTVPVPTRISPFLPVIPVPIRVPPPIDTWGGRPVPTRGDGTIGTGGGRPVPTGGDRTSDGTIGTLIGSSTPEVTQPASEQTHKPSSRQVGGHDLTSTKPKATNVTRPVTGAASRGAQAIKQKGQGPYARPGGAPGGGARAAAEPRRGKPEGAKKSAGMISPTPFPHFRAPPSSIRVGPSQPRYRPPSTRYPALKRPVGRPTPPQIR